MTDLFLKTTEGARPDGAAAHPGYPDNRDLLMRPRPNDPRLKRDRRFTLRRATAAARALPDFIILGGMKCGTGSLFHYLRQCPDMHPPLRKEIHFFTLGWRAGLPESWYRAHFPNRLALGRRGITGEATPDYLYEEGTADRIAGVVPDAKLIVLLRDPVERAVSHYFHEVRMGREHLEIGQAMALEEKRLAAARSAGPEGTETAVHAAYKARGAYAEQIEAVLERFPRERLLILGSGLLYRDPAAALARAAEFLGLDLPNPMPEFTVRNKGSNRTPVDPAVTEALERHFAPHNERLFELLGGRPDW